MKRIQNLLLLCLLALVAGCSSVTSDGPYKGDSTLYRADLTITSAYNVLHAFVLWEYQNRPVLSATPEVTQAADYIRANAAKWIGTAIALRDAYAGNPTDANRSALQLSINVLQTAMNEAVKYLSKTNPNPTIKLEK